MNLPLLSEIRRRFALHNIGVQRNVLCPITMNKHWKYGTYPLTNGGSHNHFDSKEQLYKFLLQVERVASYQTA